jgi:glycosyltransferase involved in cell wall biosynthesis
MPPDAALRVAVDATPLLGARTGVGVAVDALLRGVASRHAESVEYTAYGLTGRGWRRLAGELPSGVQPVRRPLPAGLLMRLWRGLDRPAVESWAGAVDLVHGTNYVVPPARRAARLVSIHDMAPVLYPELCAPATARYPALMRRAVQSGSHVHTGSRTVGAEIVGHLGVDPGRVHVVLYGLEPPHRPHSGAPDQPVGGGGRPYILGLGTLEPRKNFARLIQAFDLIAGEFPDLDLVIAGAPGWGREEVERAAVASPYARRVRLPGRVADPGGLLASATVFAYPSLYEGFGFPPLEAMSLGVPVVASDAGSLPEILGDDALLVPPGDVEALAGALRAAVADSAVRGRLVAAGPGRAGRYRWEDSAAGLVDVYRAVAASS